MKLPAIQVECDMTQLIEAMRTLLLSGVESRRRAAAALEGERPVLIAREAHVGQHMTSMVLIPRFARNITALAEDGFTVEDHVSDFLDEQCVSGERYFIRSARLWAAYEDWCERKGILPIGRTSFLNAVRSGGFNPSRSRRDGDEKQMRTIEGIALKERRIGLRSRAREED